jgi:hypothetical protein
LAQRFAPTVPNVKDVYDVSFDAEQDAVYMWPSAVEKQPDFNR